MKTTNAGTFDSTAAGKAIAIALIAGMSPEAKARLSAILRERQANRTANRNTGTAA
jgi:hypothetical protein